MECCLGKGDLVRLDGGTRGITVHCLRGTAWITKGDGLDYLVHQGNSFQLGARELALVEALGVAEIHLEETARQGACIKPAPVRQPCLS